MATEVTEKEFFWTDKTGRGFSSKVFMTGILDCDRDEDEVNWDDINLQDWVLDAEQGDEWENATDKYVCIS